MQLGSGILLLRTVTQGYTGHRGRAEDHSKQRVIPDKKTTHEQSPDPNGFTDKFNQIFKEKYQFFKLSKIEENTSQLIL